MKQIKLILLILPIFSFGQEHTIQSDTITFDGYIGVIQPDWFIPRAQRNIFPENRFTPSSSDVKEFEFEFLKQYAQAIKKHHILYYEREKESREDYTEKEWENIIAYKNRGAKTGRRAKRKLKREFDKYDRTYFGVKANNNIRYLRIEFTPDKENWIKIPGAGESLLQNYPPLMYELDGGILSLAGWTGNEEF